MKAKQSLTFCLNLLLAAQSLCVLFSAVAKTITCADTGNLRPACYALRERYNLKNATVSSPQTPMMTLWVKTPLRNFQGVISNVSQGLIWSFNSRLWFSVTVQRGQYNHSSQPWPRRLTHHQSPCRCVLKTPSGQDTGRKRSWIGAGSNRKAERSLSPWCSPVCVRAGREQNVRRQTR